MDVINGVDFILRPYQEEIIRSIKENVENGNRMQTIMLPNTGGKTSLALILSIFYNDAGKNVLYYNELGMDLTYATNTIRTTKERFAGVKFGDRTNIKYIKDNNYDIIITDSITSMISTEVLQDFENRVRSIDVERVEANTFQSSEGQKTLVSLHYLQEIIERDDAFVISFELNNLEDIGYTPIIATPHALTYKMTREDQIKYLGAFVEAFDIVSKKKMETIESFGVSSQEAKRCDAYLGNILNKLDKIDVIINGIDSKIDNLQNDVSIILSTVEALNSAVKGNKEILGLFFSVHEDDDGESDLFISRIVDKMTKEMISQIRNFENQEKYQQTQKLVMVRVGENVWEKMEDSSRKFLTTAKFMFMENMNLKDNIDYSSICLLSSKAFEVELVKRFVIGYEQYLQDKKIQEKNWPKAIQVFNKKSKTYRKMRKEDFTLGACPYIMGILGNDIEKQDNQKCFENYCKDRLLKSLDLSEIRKILIKYDGYIKHIKDNYRNPAAHKSSISLTEASDCLDYILEVERVLKTMLEKFEF